MLVRDLGLYFLLSSCLFLVFVCGFLCLLELREKGHRVEETVRLSD